jgi:hypothetical protein
LIWLSLLITDLRVDIVDVQFVGVKRSFIGNSVHEFLDLFLDGVTTSTSTGAISWLDFNKNVEK